MKCTICRNGTTHASHITVVLEREQTTLLFKGVPADVCENCGEEYLNSATNARLLEISSKALERGVDLEMLRYAA